MKYLCWDFDNTLGYREGMWSGTLQAGIKAILVRKPNDRYYKFYSKDFQKVLESVSKISTSDHQ
ncbi:hypothetical protein NOS3756_34910 [Nostoc sp. NIES-3756]|nr:hypothetical protein NOS3756_34910 [Nostoc sp. NIES-3756]